MTTIKTKTGRLVTNPSQCVVQHKDFIVFGEGNLIQDYAAFSNRDGSLLSEGGNLLKVWREAIAVLNREREESIEIYRQALDL